MLGADARQLGERSQREKGEWRADVTVKEKDFFYWANAFVM